MDTASFERTAARFERLSTAAPRAYRVLVVALGALGFAVLGAVFLMVLALLALVVVAGFAGKIVIALKLGVPLGAVAITLGRAAWVKLERPSGLVLEQTKVPALYAEIDRMRRLGRVPHIHRVLVDSRFNAGVSQVPRFGLFGWPHNDLVLGLPMLLALSPAQFRAVLAHELGHLSGRHGRSGAWVYRVRATWGQVLAALEPSGGVVRGVLRRFFGWYGPFFAAASLALAREQEREADRFAAAATDPRTAADALAATAVADSAIEGRFWPDMQRRTVSEAEPPASYLGDLEAVVRDELGDARAEAVLAKALAPRSSATATHPTTAERIAALGVPARVPPPLLENAAAWYLRGALAEIRAALDASWREDVGEAWRRSHSEGVLRADRLAELERAAAAGPLAPDEDWERASLLEDLRGPEVALDLVRGLVERHPDHAPARFALGRLLLARGEGEGLTHVQRAVELDADAELPAARIIAAYHLGSGSADLASPWLERAAALEALHEAAAKERESVLVSDAVAPHGLAPDAVREIVAAARRHPKVAGLYLVRKQLRHLPDRAPVFLLGVVPRRPWHRLTSSDFETRIAKEVASGLPDDPTTFVFVKGNATARMFRRLRRTPGARVA